MLQTQTPQPFSGVSEGETTTANAPAKPKARCRHVLLYQAQFLAEPEEKKAVVTVLKTQA